MEAINANTTGHPSCNKDDWKLNAQSVETKISKLILGLKSCSFESLFTVPNALRTKIHKSL